MANKNTLKVRARRKRRQLERREIFIQNFLQTWNIQRLAVCVPDSFIKAESKLYIKFLRMERVFKHMLKKFNISVDSFTETYKFDSKPGSLVYEFDNGDWTIIRLAKIGDNFNMSGLEGLSSALQEVLDAIFMESPWFSREQILLFGQFLVLVFGKTQ